MSEAWPNSREASKSVAFTSSTVAPVEEREGTRVTADGVGVECGGGQGTSLE